MTCRNHPQWNLHQRNPSQWAYSPKTFCHHPAQLCKRCSVSSRKWCWERTFLATLVLLMELLRDMGIRKWKMCLVWLRHLSLWKTKRLFWKFLCCRLQVSSRKTLIKMINFYINSHFFALWMQTTNSTPWNPQFSPQLHSSWNGKLNSRITPTGPKLTTHWKTGSTTVTVQSQ